jgi:hypothetical protein
VTLNKERAAEERRGQVRWLRPDYQIARFGTAGQKAEQIEAELVDAVGTKGKPSFPSGDVERTAAVFAALLGAAGPTDARALAASFRQGKRVEPHVRATLVALARMGHIAAIDGGTTTFSLRSTA